MINYTAQFVTICGLHLLAVASPGPDFAVVVRQSIRHGRPTAIWTSLGIGSGILVHTAYTLLGIGLIVKSSPMAFTVMKLVAAAYLAWLGIKSLRAKPSSNDLSPTTPVKPTLPTKHSAYVTGFLTNALNPKATLFFLSVFSLVVNPATPRLIQVGYGVWMAVMTAVWFTIVSLFLTHDRVRRKFLQLGIWFDRTMGVVLLALAIGVVIATVKK